MSKSSRWQPPHPASTPKHLCCWPKCVKAGVEDVPLCAAHLIVAHGIQERIEESRRRPAPAAVAPEPVKPSTGTVYYVQVGAHIKIGWASDLDKRMRSYPPNSQLLAVEPGSRKDESRTHKRFATFRTHGREWYAPVPSLLHHIEQMKAQHGLPEVSFGAAPVTIPERRVKPQIRPSGWARQIAG